MSRTLASLLPPNAAALECAVESAINGAIEAVPIPISDLWNPNRCPAPLLPWLAWQLSADHWDSGWDEARKRELLKNSIAVHRHKGTVGAMRRALDALNFRSESEEWFEYGGTAFKFRIVVTPEAGASAQDLDDALAAALSAKNTRSHLETIRVSAPVQSTRVSVALGASVGIALNVTNGLSFVAQRARSLAGMNESEGAAILADHYTLFARPYTGAFAERLTRGSGSPALGAYDETLLDRPLANGPLIGAFYLDDQFQFLLVWTLRERLDTRSPVTRLRDVFQSSGASVEAAIYDGTGQLLAQDNSGATEWVFSNGVGNLSGTYLSGDDGVWGVNLGGRVDGNTPGPGLGPKGWGAENHNGGDANANVLVIDGVRHPGHVNAIICGGFQ